MPTWLPYALAAYAILAPLLAVLIGRRLRTLRRTTTRPAHPHSGPAANPERTPRP